MPYSPKGGGGAWTCIDCGSVVTDTTKAIEHDKEHANKRRAPRATSSPKPSK